jgi:hypothetical protein
MLEFFKFARPAFATPPKLPKAPIDEAHKNQCDAGVAPASGDE